MGAGAPLLAGDNTTGALDASLAKSNGREVCSR